MDEAEEDNGVSEVYDAMYTHIRDNLKFLYEKKLLTQPYLNKFLTLTYGDIDLIFNQVLDLNNCLSEETRRAFWNSNLALILSPEAKEKIWDPLIDEYSSEDDGDSDRTLLTKTFCDICMHSKTAGNIDEITEAIYSDEDVESLGAWGSPVSYGRSLVALPGDGLPAPKLKALPQHALSRTKTPVRAAIEAANKKDKKRGTKRGRDGEELLT